MDQRTYMIHFAWPFMFLLLPLPFLFRRFFSVSKQDFSSAVKVPFFYEVKSLTFNTRTALFSRRIFLYSVAWIFLVIAAARPQIPDGMQGYTVPVRDILLVIDISGSMEQKDFLFQGQKVQRLQAVKTVADGFIQSRKGDRIGVILFAEQANLYVPLTVDYPTLRTMLSGAEVGLLGSVTSMGDALGLSVKYLEKSGAKHKVVVLLTDGVSNAGNIVPLDALSLAKSAGVSVYTVGVGIEKEGEQGIDKTVLQRIASETGSLFFMAEDGTALQDAYQEISAGEPLSETEVYLLPQKELYPYPLFVFMSLMTFSVFRRLAATLTYRRRKNV